MDLGQSLFIYNGKEVGRHERKFTKGQTYYDYQHYLPILARKQGALRNGAPFINMDLPDELNKVKKALEQQENGSRDFAHILSYIPVKSIESVIDACSYALEMKAVSKDVILNALFRRNELAIQNTKEENLGEDPVEDPVEDQGVKLEEDSKYLELKYAPEENCSSYDQLLSAVSIQDLPQTMSTRRLSL